MRQQPEVEDLAAEFAGLWPEEMNRMIRLGRWVRLKTRIDIQYPFIAGCLTHALLAILR